MEAKCDTVGCPKSARLRCPTCIKLGISGSFFCSQECFKGSWNQHKLLHKPADELDETISCGEHQLPEQKSHQPSTHTKRKPKVNRENLSAYQDLSKYNPWPGYTFTGKLRPYPTTATREVPEYIERPDYANHPKGHPLSEMELKGSTHIKVLDDEEIEGVRTASKLARQVLDVAANAVEVGITTDEIDLLVHEACIDRECYPSPLNYYNFPKSCCTSVNEVICHGIPDLRPLQDGDILNVDITVYHRGFHGDLNETFLVGHVDEVGSRLVRVSYECLMRAIDIVKPGVRYRDLGNVIQKHAQSNGFSVVRSYCGHGIHRLFHTAPSVPHYAKNKAIGIMKAGHVFTIEPMVSEGTWRDTMWPDHWTAVTQDGKRSAQFEHTLLVTDLGCEILTLRQAKGGQPYFLD